MQLWLVKELFKINRGRAEGMTTIIGRVIGDQNVPSAFLRSDINSNKTIITLLQFISCEKTIA